MKRLQQRVWYYYFCASFALLFVPFYPVQWVLLQRKEWYAAAHSYRSFWARLVLFIWGVRYEVINPQFARQPRPVIICSNHSSYIDILVFLAVFRQNTCFMAKAELSDIPFFGIYFRTIDIEVDRGNGEQGAMAYRKAVKALQGGQNLVIYPEGGILPDPLLVKPFKDGAFQLAIRQKTPILPVGLPDNYKIIPDAPQAAKPGKIRIILHELLQTADLKPADMERLKEKLTDILQKDIES
jgi:1-acyl-sn-glycerol-3-phosphate acyltransferase